MDEEKDLIEAFDSVVHKEFPNPRRIDCPGDDLLAKLAAQPGDPQLAWILTHVRRCAPCFDELKNLRRQTKARCGNTV